MRPRESPDGPSITVDVEDAFGNIVTNDGSKVALAVASGPGIHGNIGRSGQQRHRHVQQRYARHRRELYPDRQ